MEDSSVSRSGQSQHHYEPTIDTPRDTDVDVPVQVSEINYADSSQQDQYQPQFMAQQQQDYQPPQQQQPSQQPMLQQSQAQRYPTPPQTNQAYGAPPTAGPVQFPSPAPGPHRIPSQPEQFPPQNPNQPAAYPPQTAQFPPQNPTQPAAYPPQAPQSSQAQPVQFPPQPAAYPPQSPQMKPMYPCVPSQPAPCAPPPISGIYPPQGAPLTPAFTQAANQSPQPHSLPFASQGAARVYNPSPSLNNPTAVEGIPLEMHKGPQQQNYNEQWNTGLFDCMEDPNNAVMTAFVPCVTFGQISEIVDNGQTTCSNNGLFYGLIGFCVGMPCIMSFGYRTKLRAKYGLVEAPGPDWAVHLFFEWCALCQEYRELQHRGFDPAIGWQGNVTRQRMQEVAMTPPMKQQMMP